LDYYIEEINIFLKWAIEAGAHTLEDITPDVLRAYFLNLGSRRNVTGVHTNYGAVKTLLLWAWGEFELPGSCPIAKVKVATPEAEPKPGVSLEDISRLLEACNGKRDRAILLFLLDTGVRRRELCVLNISDLTNDTVHLSKEGTKTGKARVAFISLDTRKAIRAYFRERSEIKPNEPLFTAKGGGRLTVSGLRQIIRRLCVAADIPEVGLHDFRRTFALESLRAGADVVSVSRLLGHASIEVTKRYLAQVEEDLKAAHAKASPVDTLLRKRR
jgi:integrase/recombinase XerD